MASVDESRQRLLATTEAIIGGAHADATLDLPDIGLAITALADHGRLSDAAPDCPNLVVELLEAVDIPNDSLGQAMLTALCDTAPSLQWVDPYADRTDQVALRAGYFVAVLVGDHARETSLAFGTEASIFVTVQAPHILYPPHSHLAPELYYAVAGTAEWKKGDGPFEPKPPGSWMVHEPWTSHAMQTRSEPLVALAIWTADLDCAATLDD